MVRNIQDSGRTTREMEKEGRTLRMAPFISASLKMERKMAPELTIGVKAANTKEIGRMIVLMAMVSIPGQMVESIAESGKATSFAGMEFMNGVMAENTRVNLKTIKSMAAVSSDGPAEKYMTENGTKVFNMVTV